MSAIVLIPVEEFLPARRSVWDNIRQRVDAIKALIPDKFFIRDYYLPPIIHRVALTVHAFIPRPRPWLSAHDIPRLMQLRSPPHRSTICKTSPSQLATPLLSGHLALARIIDRTCTFTDFPTLQTATCAAFQPSEAVEIPRITISASTSPSGSPPHAWATTAPAVWSEEESEAFREELAGSPSPRPKLRCNTNLPTPLRADGKIINPFINDDEEASEEDAGTTLRFIPTCPDLHSLLETDDERLDTPDTPDSVNHIMLHTMLYDAVTSMRLQSVWTYEEGDLGLSERQIGSAPLRYLQVRDSVVSDNASLPSLPPDSAPMQGSSRGSIEPHITVRGKRHVVRMPRNPSRGSCKGKGI